MRRLIILTSLNLILVLSLNAQVKFSNESWKEILDSAKSKNLSVFVDIYTDWCGPCKLMDKTTFNGQNYF